MRLVLRLFSESVADLRFQVSCHQSKLISKHHPDDRGFEDQLAVDQSLHLTGTSSRVDFHFLANQHEAVTGHDLSPVLDVFRTDESHELLFQTLKADEAGQLGSRFEHQHTGEQGASRDMAGDPEFVIANVFESNDLCRLFELAMDDAIKQSHGPTVGIDRFDYIHAMLHSIKVVLRNIKK